MSAHVDDPTHGVEEIVNQLVARPETKGYKFIVTTTQLRGSAQGPIKTSISAHWNEQHDGIQVFKIEGLVRQIVSVVWIHV